MGTKEILRYNLEGRGRREREPSNKREEGKREKIAWKLGKGREFEKRNDL